MTDASGVRTSEARYKPWGEQRYASGMTPTTFRFTGQRQEQSIGLYYYGARWYDLYLTRQGWGETEIQDYMSAVNDYVRNVMSTDVEYFGLGQDVADEIINLATALGMQ